LYWYYVENNKSMGPVSEQVLRQLIASEQVTPADLVWKQGMQDWAAANGFFDFPNQRRAVPQDINTAGREQEDADVMPKTSPVGLYSGAPPRSFGEVLAVGFNKYATFSGRASRSEFWYMWLAIMIGSVLTSFLDAILFPYNEF
jgi:hypothetical protein